LALAVTSFSEGAILHLGVRNVKFIAPIIVGDTVSAAMEIKSIRPTSDKLSSIVTSRHFLLRDGKVVVQADKLTLFNRIALEVNHLDLNDVDHNVDQPINSVLPGSHQVPVDLRRRRALKPWRENDLILHRLVKAWGEAENRMLLTLLRVTNSHHHDSMKHKPSEILVAGPLVVSSSLSLTLADLGLVWKQSIWYSNNLNPVNPGDCITALSYVHKDVVHPERNCEELTLLTIGVKNISPERLAHLCWPKELFEDPAKPLTRKQVERLLADHVELFHKVACLTYWTVLRPLCE